MTLLVELNLNHEIRYLSNEDIELGRQWEGLVKGLTPLEYYLPDVYGGFCQLRFGDIEFQSRLFENSDDWPPPQECSLNIRYTPSDETQSFELFSGMAYLRSFDTDGVRYELFFRLQYNKIKLLDQDWGYDPNAIGIINPGAFKWSEGDQEKHIYFLEAARGGRPMLERPQRISMMGRVIQETDPAEMEIDSWAWGDLNALGFETVYICLPDQSNPSEGAPGFLRADYSLHKSSYPQAFGKIFHQKPFKMADLYGKPCFHKAGLTGKIGVDWHVYDEGAEIDANVEDHGEFFTLLVDTAGMLTISGSGQPRTMVELIEWVCGKDKFDKICDVTHAGPEIEISYWASEQMLLSDFLSDICAFFSHLCYIRSDTLYLVDMNESAASWVSYRMIDFDTQPVFFYPPVVATIQSQWFERKAVEEDAWTNICEVKQSVATHSGYSYGHEYMINPFHTDQTKIEDAQQKLLKTTNHLQIKVVFPIRENLPAPGEVLTWTETGLQHGMICSIKANCICYDFMHQEITIEGLCHLS